MVDRYPWPVQRVGRRFHPTHADEERPDQTRARCDAEDIDVRELEACLLECQGHHSIDLLEVRPRGELRDHTTVDLVHVL